MNRCPQCLRGLPDDAAFCIYCAAQLRPATQMPPHRPATGATIRLNPLAGAAPIQTKQPKPKQHRRHHHHGHWQQHKHHGRHGHHIPLGPIFMIGMLFMFFTSTWFPGIFVLLGLLGFIRATMYGRPLRGLQQLVFMGGLALLIASRLFFPGIFLLMFLMHFISHAHNGRKP